jgi:hypothetical protein
MNAGFMLSDLARTSEAVLLFSVVVVMPGYVFAWLLNILHFRQRRPLTRLAISVPLSIGICPIITYSCWRLFSPAVWFFYGACSVLFIVLLAVERRKCLRFKGGLLYFVIAGVWVTIAMLSLIDMQLGDRLYFPTVTSDYALRSAFTSAISRTGVPPHNPYFFAGHFFNLRYHYFWFILCSVVQQIAGNGVSPRQAVLAGTVWSGIGLLAIVPLYLCFFASKGNLNIRRRAIIGIALLAVTGLDIYPIVLAERATHALLPHIEVWNDDQVSAWITAVMWVPHHVASLVACLMGFLVLWDAAQPPGSRKARIVAVIAAALTFSSAFGLSIYVTLVFAAFLTVWTCIALVRNRREMAGLICFSGLAALVLSIPWLGELFAGQGAGTGGAAGAAGLNALPLQFAVRHFFLVDVGLGLTDGGWRQNLTNLIVLPLNYLLELGFFLVAGVIQCKRMWRERHSLSEDQLCGLTMAITSIVICTFVRSTVIANNDFGIRGFMIAQFVLLIWGAEMLADGLLARGGSSWNISGRRRLLVMAMLVLGVAGSVYEVVKIRFYPLQSDMALAHLERWLSQDRNVGARTFALRQVYEELKRRTPASAVFQTNPDAEPQDNFHGMYADRQLAAGTSSCGVVFGGDASLCQSRIGEIEALFQNPKDFDSAGIDKACRQLSIDVLVVKDTDKVWQDRESWVWHRTPMVANSYGRAFDCGTRTMLTAKR